MRQLRLMPNELALGMYVAELDRPWTETHFMFQGFRLDSNDDLRYIRDTCAFVIIDLEKGDAPRKLQAAAGAELSAAAPSRAHTLYGAGNPSVTRRAQGAKSVGSATASYNRLPPRHTEYPDQTTVESEFSSAEAALGSVQSAYSDLVSTLRNSRSGTLDLGPVQETVSDMQHSIIRNPDAMMLLCHLRSRDAYTYRHAISSSVLAIVFGRHLGLKRSQIHDLGLGLLLADVGKIHMPRVLLDAPRRLKEGELRIMHKHVEASLQTVERSPGLSPGVRAIVRSHHERFNGRGYPDGLAGDDIPVLARIAGIVDTYDAMTSERVYARGLSALEAIKALYAMRSVEFQSELVEQFIQALGIYPVGTLVLLSSGAVAVVIGINRLRRLLPKVMILLDADKQPVVHNQVVDLADQPLDEAVEALVIREALPPGSFDIDPEDYYL